MACRDGTGASGPIGRHWFAPRGGRGWINNCIGSQLGGWVVFLEVVRPEAGWFLLLPISNVAKEISSWELRCGQVSMAFLSSLGSDLRKQSTTTHSASSMVVS